MIHRILLIATALSLLGDFASADVVVTERRIHGLSAKIDGAAVTKDNAMALLDKSKGNVAYLGYKGLTFKAGRKETVVAWEAVLDFGFKEADPAWLEGEKFFGIGDYANALSAYRDVLANAEARTVFKVEAAYYATICLFQLGQTKKATTQFKAWSYIPSQHTPDVYRILAELAIRAKKYGEARTWYKKIGELPDAPAKFGFEGRLGGVKVDVEEKNFPKAEESLGLVKAAIKRAGKGVNDARAGAAILQAMIAIRSEDVGKLPAAEKTLIAASKLDHVNSTNKAALYAGLGDILFKAGRSDEARFPYLRVVCMYGGETDHVGNCLLNAGQCFVNLYNAEKEADKEKACQYLTEGVKLLKSAGRKRYPGWRKARAAHSKYKPQLEAWKK